MKYEIHDSHGAPQCGCEITRFESFWEMDDYFEEHPDVYERTRNGYATIVEVPRVEKFAIVVVERAVEGRPRSETVAAIVECDEEVAEGLCEEFCQGRYRYSTYRRYNGESVGDVTEK